MEHNHASNNDGLRRGVITFIILAVLTVIEYLIGVFELPSFLLWVMALVKAGLVLYFFMHIARIFSSDGGH